ncbi:DUF2971 domain-containing protein [Halobacteriovorax sp. JY17]|uniref:DUF2971 domain-containing protein n=1 Tax=Halobacteriovorax sp. JY17 TaxID=2014617 RepID=UPI000C494F9A|nr:DUF2971 domain-containing protein [Halobacteriovorax sp. JY17]PIK13534.1 MAG: hypothetical protein CES88_16575 [Halobacteriovorax sp. JY17]
MKTFEADRLESLFRFFDYTGGIETLKNKRLRFKTADQFNDPYELLPSSFIPDINFQELSNEEILDEMKNVDIYPLNSLPPGTLGKLPLEAIENGLRPLLEKNIKSYSEGVRQVFENYRKTSFINCLTHRVDILRMWSDYADKGKGIAIEFEVSVERDNFFRCAKEVKYHNSPPKLYTSLSELFVKGYEASKPENWKSLFEYFSYSKSDDWKNEEEWRVIMPDMSTDTYCDYTFSPEDILTVYLGYNLLNKEEIINEVRNLNKNIKIIQVEVNNHEHGLIMKNI